MRIIKFDRCQEIPVVEAIVFGPRKYERVKLVFDTGCGTTQLDTNIVESLGYSASNALARTVIKGPSGDTQEGYLVAVKDFKLFGRYFSDLRIGVHDFDTFEVFNINGLLGFDIIKQLHLELNGLAGELRVF